VITWLKIDAGRCCPRGAWRAHAPPAATPRPAVSSTRRFSDAMVAPPLFARDDGDGPAAVHSVRIVRARDRAGARQTVGSAGELVLERLAGERIDGQVSEGEC